MIRLYPDSISAIAFVVVIVLGLAAYCRLVWAERDRDHRAKVHADRQCFVSCCHNEATSLVGNLGAWYGACARCAEELVALGYKEFPR